MLFRSVALLSLALTACGSPKGPDAATPAAPATSATPAASAKAPHWSYDGELGPSHWGAIDPSFAACASGASQSPVNLLAASMKVSGKPPAPPSWAPVPLKIVNNGHTIQVDDTAPSSFVVDGATYALKNFHFHSPSEHTIDGRSYDVEMHFVHKTPDGKIAVVALMFDRGRANEGLAPLWGAMPSVAGPPVTNAATIDVQTLLPKAPKYLRYDGSLTVPPCTEGVTWLVVVPDPAAPLELSDAQIAQLRGALHSPTNRPVQPLGARPVVELAP